MDHLGLTIVLGTVVIAAMGLGRHGWLKTGVVINNLCRAANLGAAVADLLTMTILSGLVDGTTFTSSSLKACFLLALPFTCVPWGPFTKMEMKKDGCCLVLGAWCLVLGAWCLVLGCGKA